MEERERELRRQEVAVREEKRAVHERGILMKRDMRREINVSIN